MKLIDIYVKIANDEEVPKKVKFNNEIYTYKPEWKDYADEDEHYGLLVDTIPSTYQITKMLNEEIEIIEEDKKIEKLENEKEFYAYTSYEKNKNDIDKILYILKALNLTEEKIDNLNSKMNELIDEVNKLKGGSDANR